MFVKLGLAIFIATYVSSATALPPCTCTRNLRPVCGSDGHTYANQCLLECEVSKGKSITVAKDGQCDSDLIAAQPVCICTYEYKPVCGTDGETYPNSCALDCEKAKKADLALARTGACDSQPALPPPCTICPANYLPVCASDGKSYPNSCIFDCEKSKNAALEIVHQGSCESVNVVNNAEQRDCLCGYKYLPVCGSNGQDYPNMCTFECDQKKDPSLTVSRTGRCNEPSTELYPITVGPASPPTPVCLCTRDMKQVCGSDGHTYNNKCLLECSQGVNKSLELSHEGAC